MQGEAVASGSVHVDNIAPSLFGGLVLTVGIDNPFVKQIPVPASVRCVIVHPHMVLATREARAILSKSVELSDVIWQQANLAGFLAGCFTWRPAADPRIADGRRDRAATPGAHSGIRGGKAGALAAGALGCSISGAGPTVFAWAEEGDAESVRLAWSRRSAARPRDRQLGFGHRPRRRKGRGRLMRYLARATHCTPSALATAISRGLAPDGGLYVPEALPTLDAEACRRGALAELAARLLRRSPQAT